ncbi:hypothetical protein K432DRAFT_439422 [Lepidopterella palustris CBS 459.81]|uniref:DUF676 domain-containing protein n=1 Tax=Lepidopterella palustris CBS 459.81 TaxID=1314670 RepID=A0A8E2EKK1_9PEZI|nr:hypothetical protein K432DRAFT_439422 [Lepidopterella palustris CBS 459.81]
MPIELVTADGIETKIDIVAVPAIGANPRATFRYPGLHNPQPGQPCQHVFSDVPDARVFLYTFEEPDPAKLFGITRYAEGFLRDLSEIGFGQRFIHFVGHSTGGLVIKRALVLANGSNNESYLTIKRKCCSIAFFGTPQYGSTVLSQATYKQAVAKLLDLKPIMTNKLRSDLQNIENLDGLQHFSRAFAPLAINMDKIWTFVEAKDSRLQVKVASSVNDHFGSTSIYRTIVDKRCAWMSFGDRQLIGCEEVITVDSDHACLPRFGDDPSSVTFIKYIAELRNVIDRLALKGQRDPKWLENELKVEVHLFYDLFEEDQASVKIWSVYPYLRNLLNEGPAACLEGRVNRAVENQETNESHPRQSPTNTPDYSTATTLRLDRPLSPKRPEIAPNLTAQPIQTEEPQFSDKRSSQPHVLNMQENLNSDADFKIANPEPRIHVDTDIERHSNQDENDTGSETSTPTAYKLPDISQSRFRWIHIPANNMVWVEKIFQAVEKERELKRFNKAAESTHSVEDMPYSPESQMPETEEIPTAELSVPLEDPAKSHLLKAAELLSKKNDPIEAPRLGEAIRDPRKATRLLKASQTVPDPREAALIPEASQVIEDLREKSTYLEVSKELVQKGEFPQPIFIANAIQEERNKPRLGSSLLDKQFWISKQYNSRHGLPHGRFMQPFFQLFMPRIPSESGLTMRNSVHISPMASPIESPQLCVYLPYLHWDTFGGLKKRNALVKKRMEDPLNQPVNQEIEMGTSMEYKLIWQYLMDASGLPLHIRRSLDQFGNPVLEDTTVRDHDQVLYKCTKPESPLKLTNPSGTLTQSAFQPADLRAQSEDDAKVLMVDQLWCWVIDKDTVSTFFPAKEESPSKTVIIQGDLHNEIYDDVNGDQRFASQCTDPFDFAALAVWHAITVFLNQTTDRDLKVFTVFQEWICELTEQQTSSFKDFRDCQSRTKDIFRRRLTSDADGYGELFRTLDPSKDLSALLELRDVQDELNMLLKLFSRQADVVDEMLNAYRVLDEDCSKHDRAVVWLKDASIQIKKYQAEAKDLLNESANTIKDCERLLDMKQKQSDVVEASFARLSAETGAEQNRSIMVFTTFTIIFLPLSFFTSLFGMNVRDWSGTKSNKSLTNVLALMGSISAAVIIIALFLAFTRHPLAKIKKAPSTVKETHWLMLQRLSGRFKGLWWKRERVERGREERRDGDLERGREGLKLGEGGRWWEWRWGGKKRANVKGVEVVVKRRDGRADSKID